MAVLWACLKTSSLFMYSDGHCRSWLISRFLSFDKFCWSLSKLIGRLLKKYLLLTLAIPLNSSKIELRFCSLFTTWTMLCSFDHLTFGRVLINFWIIGSTLNSIPICFWLSIARWRSVIILLNFLKVFFRSRSFTVFLSYSIDIVILESFVVNHKTEKDMESQI